MCLLNKKYKCLQKDNPFTQQHLLYSQSINRKKKTGFYCVELRYISYMYIIKFRYIII